MEKVSSGNDTTDDQFFKAQSKIVLLYWFV